MLLPSFDVVARLIKPLTAGMLRMGTSRHRKGQSGVRRNHSGTRKANGKGQAEVAVVDVAAPAPPPEVEAVQEGQARELLRNLADFRETMVREVMTPRPDIIAIDSDATIEQLTTLYREQQYSRVPVFKESMDNVQGFVFIKDLIQRLPTIGPSGSIAPLVRPAHFVPETKRVPELLKEFQRKRHQIAIVVDEYGGTAGLVTVEDLLEEIVGEIRDEDDVEVERIVDEGGGKFLLAGSVHVDEMANLLKAQIDGHGFETVGGYLLSRLGRVPAIGEHLEVDGFDVEIVDTQRRRITRVRMSRLEPVPATEVKRRHENGARRAGRPAQCRQIHAAQSSRSAKARDRFRQTPNHPQPHRRRPELPSSPKPQAPSPSRARSFTSTRLASINPFIDSTSAWSIRR